MLDSWITTVLTPLGDVAAMLFDPAKRVFWPFLVISFAIAAVAYRWDSTRGSAHRARSLFSKQLWLHRSSLVDIQLMVAKAAIRAFLFAPLLLSAFAIAVFVVEQLTLRCGVAGPSTLSRWHITVLYTITLFVTWDFSRFALHRIMHAVPFLWELHKVHHSAEVLTPLTNYRTHPIESLLYSMRGAIVTGVVSGVFFYLFRSHAVQYDILGVNAVGIAFNAVGANLRHSHVWITYGRWMEHLFISPAQHQLHHSREPQHRGRNYGSFLAIWDWLFRSLYIAGKRQPFRVGLSDSECNHNPRKATSCLIRPITASLRMFVPSGGGNSVPSTPPRGLHEIH